MTNQASLLRNLVRELKSNLAQAEAKLSNLEHSCRHEFGLPVSNPIIKPGYTDPGDAPGTMGIDRRFSCYVPEQRTERWTRICNLCGITQSTTETTQKVSAAPYFR